MGSEVDHVSFSRDSSGQCLLLKVEVVVQGPTFFIVFADADVMPPPFRLDNLTDVSPSPRYLAASVAAPKFSSLNEAQQLVKNGSMEWSVLRPAPAGRPAG